MTVAQIEVPVAKVGELCRRNGIRRLSLFGSVLTERFSDASDIDLLVEFRPGERVGFFRLAGIEDELGRLFGGRKIDLRTPMELSRYFRDEGSARDGHLCRTLTQSGCATCGTPPHRHWKWPLDADGPTLTRV